MSIAQKIASAILGRSTASAATCEGPSYQQYSCRKFLAAYERIYRWCHYNSCDRRTYCGPWVGYSCVYAC